MAAIKPGKYIRKPVVIEAVLVTEANINDVARWCGGQVVVDLAKPENTHIKVRVIKPQDEEQTKAFVGRYILKLGKSFKVYTQEAFNKGFEEAPAEVFASADDLLRLKNKLNSEESRKSVSGIMHRMSGGAFSSAEDYNKFSEATFSSDPLREITGGEIQIVPPSATIITGDKGETIYLPTPAESIDLS